MNNKKYIPYIDSHCHYDALSKEYLKDLFLKNNIISLTASTDFKSYKHLEEIRNYNIPNLYFAYGLYPDCVLNKSLNKCLKDLEKIDFSKANAIGEIGIDYKITKDKQKREEQKTLFRKQLEIAQKLKKPVVIHSRYAEKPVLEILEDFNLKVILHWFNGSEKFIDKALNKKYYLTQRYAHISYEKIKTNLDLVLIETDYPVAFNNKKNTPKIIIKSYEEFSKKYNINIKKLKQIINNNFNKLFD